MTSSASPFKVVVLYSAGHLGSALVMNRLVDMEEIEVVGVVKAQPLSLTSKGKSQISRQLKKVGWRFAWLLFFQRCVQGLGYSITLVVPGLRKRLLPAWKIARNHNIPVFRTRDINGDAAVAFIKQCNPDLLLYAYFSQILKTGIIQIPRVGVLNIHPGWLPAYRGAMAYFWVLHNGSDRGGVTVHWIDEGIDSGQILARRTFPIREKSTQETVLTFTALIGTRLLRRVIRKLQANGDPELSAAVDAGETGRYYPMPGDKEFDSYFRQRRFFRIRDVLGLIVFRQ